MRGQRIRDLRLQRGLQQQELTEIIRAATGKAVNQETVSRWENNRNQPDPDMLMALAEALHVSVDYLLGMDDKAPDDRPAIAVEPDLAGVVDKLNSLALDERRAIADIVDKIIALLTSQPASRQFAVSDTLLEAYQQLSPEEFAQVRQLIEELKRRKEGYDASIASA